MTSGTKVLLALIGLFVGILVLYYGFLMPNTPPGAGGLVRDPVLEKSESPALAAARKAVQTPSEAPKQKVTARQVQPFAAAETGTLDRTSPPGAADAQTAAQAAGNVAGSLSGAAQRAATARAMGGGAKPAPATQRTARQPAATSTQTPTRTPPPAAAPPPAPEYTRYVVKDGDTLTSIAERWFDDHRKWDLIAQINSVDPNRLKVGQTLRLPPRDVARRPIQRSQNTTHTVRSGDSLFSIAQAYYGDRGLWKNLYAANRDRIGPDPDALKVGMKLRVP